MDSSGIGVIMGRYRHIFLLGGEVWAIHTSERMRQILNMSGVTKIIQIYEEGNDVMEYFNEMEVVLTADRRMRDLQRVAVAAFMTQMDPVLEEVADVKTAVSEAVTNSIIHGYEGRTSGKITVWCGIEKDKKTILVTVKDHGIGIENVEQAMEPLYTTRPDMDRSGMGFAIYGGIYG